MEHKIVSRHTDGPFRYQAWPTVAKAEDGTLFAAASGHRLNHVCPFGKDLMYVSKDEGETWSCPVIINDTYLDDRDAGLLAWGDGNLLLTYFSTSAEKFKDFDLEDGKPHINVSTPLAMGMRKLWETLPAEQMRPGCWTRISRDIGMTWSDPRKAPVSSPHGPCRLTDGTLLFVGSIVENGSFESPDYTTRIQMFQSKDDGETWEFLSYIPMPEGADQACHEPHAIQMANGDVLVAVRYENTYKPVMKSLRVYTTISHDNGKTWQNSVFREDQHGAPPHLLQHSSGAVVLVYSRRLEPMGQYAQVSYDYGKTWSEEVMLSPEESTGTPAWDHGYPSSVELSNGDIFTLYYQKCPGDDYCSLHSIRWSLEEIK